MYDRGKIENIYGVVGMNQPYDPAYAILDAENQLSRSGLKVDKVSAFAKVAYLKETQDYVGISNDDFNEDLKRIQINSIIDVIDDVYREPDILESQPLFSDSPDIFEMEKLEGKFVGYEILLREKSNVALQINNAWLYFAETGSINLLLFNQFKQESLFDQVIGVTANDLKEQALGWTIYLSGSLMAGRYYLGYLTDGAPAFKDGFRCANDFCNISICEGSVDKTTETTIDPELWEGEGLDYGLNFDFSVKKDISDSIVRNELTIAKAVALKMTMKFIEVYIASMQSNTQQRIISNVAKMRFELHGNKEHGVPGLEQKYTAEVKKVRQSFTCYGDAIHVNSEV